MSFGNLRGTGTLSQQGGGLTAVSCKESGYSHESLARCISGFSKTFSKEHEQHVFRVKEGLSSFCPSHFRALVEISF
jgi:hypothetical protein